MLIDTHTHLHFKAFDEDRDEVIKRTLESNVFCINVGTQKDTSKAAVELAEAHNGFWATVGLHPIHTSKSYHDPMELGLPSEALAKEGFTSRGEVFDSDFYENLAGNPSVVAIGECGLDYYRISPENRVNQEAVFRSQVQLAKKVNKKLMIHCRPSSKPDKSYSTDAYDDLIKILKEEGGDEVGGNIHFFVGSWDIAEKFLEMNFSFSFPGVITITSMYDDVVKKIPLSSILIETDAPYVAPIPYRGRRNEPLYVKEVARRIAELRGISFEEVSEATTQNAKRIFGLNF